MFSSTYNGEYEDVKAVHDGVGDARSPVSTAAYRVLCEQALAQA